MLVKRKLLVPKSRIFSFLLQEKIWVLLEPAKENDVLSRFVDIFLLILIFLNVLMVILETVEDLFLNYNKFFRIFEYFSVLIFSLEYAGRFWSCVEDNHKIVF